MLTKERNLRIEFQGKEIFVIRPEDLIISKLLWNEYIGGSERQIKDCESIYRLNYEDLDLEYIERWVKTLSIENEFSKLL